MSIIKQVSSAIKKYTLTHFSLTRIAVKREKTNLRVHARDRKLHNYNDVNTDQAVGPSLHYASQFVDCVSNDTHVAGREVVVRQLCVCVVCVMLFVVLFRTRANRFFTIITNRFSTSSSRGPSTSHTFRYR